MGQQELYSCLCKKCYIKIFKPSKKDIKKMVMTEYKDQCDSCKREDFIVDYVEDYND